jgi:glyoxylase-like metal-dependent hydrolase (beta-lactamase superfamily II)/8-oxo-dGTP pyrophosphatase MutT (NUDIX family)
VAESLPAVEPQPAATVVLLRAGVDGLEVLLTRRPPSMAFAPDMFVFPGGRVDDADGEPALLARGDPGTTPAEVAAIRELFEEAGVLLAVGGSAADRVVARLALVRGATSFPAIAESLDLRLATASLTPLSRWITPPSMPRRFDARFFAAAFPADAAVTYESDEVVDDVWIRPVEALEAMAEGRLAMWLPTSSTLQQLEHVGSMEEIRERLAPGSRGEVVVEELAPDVVRIEMPSGGGVDGQPVNAYLVGGSSIVLVDPGDPTGPGLDRALAEAARRGGSIEAICLTQASPDHAGGAEALREQLGVPVFVGPGGGRHLPYPTTEVGEGDAVGPLVAAITPGLRPDHLAFIVGGALVLSGDLDGVRGARSIPGPTEQAVLDESVRRLRAMAPGARWLGGHPAVA